MKRFLIAASFALACVAPAFAQETGAAADPAVQPPPVETADQASAETPAPDTPAAEPAAVPAEPVWTGPVVTLRTTMGEIEITLDMVGAPKTAKQFLSLVKSGHYNGAIFYRIEPGFVIQLGDLDRDLKYRAPKLKPVPLETENNRHARGAVALARGEAPDSGTSTFYFDLAENAGLNATPGAPPNTTGYAVFGHVTRGMDVVDAIAAVELAPEGGPFPGKLPQTPVVVTRATVTKE